jgi:enoyl-[acyl-carrier protein] reductase III
MSWAIVLGVSSGIGAGVARALAAGGHHVVGLHLDLSARESEVQQLLEELRSHGVQAHFFNANAAAAGTIEEIVKQLPRLTDGEGVDVLVHSMAFGSLLPFIASDPTAEGSHVGRRQMDMTFTVMAHSLVYWTQALVAADCLRNGAKVFAMTSAGSERVTVGYGAVSAAKAALESHVRQLALELAPRDIAVNAIRAGVTDTPALRKIPGAQQLVERVRAANPFQRLTTPEDVADVIAGLCRIRSTWLTGNVLGVDGGELHCT